MKKHLREILREMCNRVNAKISYMDFEDGWYNEYEWTEEERKEFKEWMTEYLCKNAEARNELMFFPSKDPKILSKFCNMFVFNYGWRLKDDRPKKNS